MKVGFYLRNKHINDIDLSEPEKGNPGVGGTQFLTVSLPYYFEKHIDEEVSSILYANDTEKLPESLTVRSADSVLDALEAAHEADIDFFVWRPVESDNGKRLLANIDSYNVDLICWMHNVTSARFLHELNVKDRVAGFVFVGREQLDTLRDCRIFDSSTYIFNGFDTTHYKPDSVTKEDQTVTYIGSLIPAKGFHVLAKLWPKIEREVPGAHLRVIGTGRLYDRSKRLGRWEIASESYEKRFRPYLSNSNGEPRESVTFEGLVDTEKKIELLQNSTVGVANPAGHTANCPGSAIEFQAAGTPVVSTAYRGMFDVVQDGRTGLLGKSEDEIGEHIVSLLCDQERAVRMGTEGIEFIEDRFNYVRVCERWLDTFRRLRAGRSLPEQPLLNKYHYYKYAIEGNRLVKRHLPFGERLPCLMRTREIISSLRP